MFPEDGHYLFVDWDDRRRTIGFADATTHLSKLYPESAPENFFGLFQIGAAASFQGSIMCSEDGVRVRGQICEDGKNAFLLHMRFGRTHIELEEFSAIRNMEYGKKMLGALMAFAQEARIPEITIHEQAVGSWWLLARMNVEPQKKCHRILKMGLSQRLQRSQSYISRAYGPEVYKDLSVAVDTLRDDFAPWRELALRSDVRLPFLETGIASELHGWQRGELTIGQALFIGQHYRGRCAVPQCG